MNGLISHYFPIIVLLPILVLTTDPRFNHNEKINLLMIPADVDVGSVIYRLVASDADFDYPLQFELIGEFSKSILTIETLPCTKYNSVCQANVILQKKLEIGRYYDFKVIARDTKGGKCILLSTINATNATLRKEFVFPKIPTFIVVAEDTKRGTDLDNVIARKNPFSTKPVILELHKSNHFGVRQKLMPNNNDTKGVIFLLNQLDYEKQSMHHLILCANNPYVDPKKDSRNIVCAKIVVIVNDVQDMAPVFVQAPPVTKLDNSLFPGDVVVRVRAEDGDRGNPRDIRYGLISEGNPFTSYFNITDSTGEVILLRSLDEINAISHHGIPILLTVLAEEVKKNQNDPEVMTSTIELAFILDERGNEPPYFENENYVSFIDENAIQGTMLVFREPYVPQVKDNSPGKNGIFSLTLENNNGTFEIKPNVAERFAVFSIIVRDNTLLDYEQFKSLQFTIIAQELGPISNLTSKAYVVVHLNDVNDNGPEFVQKQYEIGFAENVTANTKLIKVEAIDRDSGQFAKIRYTQILGSLNKSLTLDPETGWILIASGQHGFDAETRKDYELYAEASDLNGQAAGNRVTVPLRLHLTDVNDEKPQFDKPIYEFVLDESASKFTTPAFVRAHDLDTDPPNNIVNYEITYGNYGERYVLNRETGEFTVNEQSVHDDYESSLQQNQQPINDMQILTIRAYDLGVPHQSSTAEVHVYTSESRSRNMYFVVAGKNPDKLHVQKTLAAITGGHVQIKDIRPFDANGRDDFIMATDMTSSDVSNTEKSIILANIAYNKNSVIDLDQLKRTLSATNESSRVTESLNEENTYRKYKDETSTLFWLLMLLALLFLLTLISLVCCCVCRGCPLFIAPKIDKQRLRQQMISSIETEMQNDYEQNERRQQQQHQTAAHLNSELSTSLNSMKSVVKPTHVLVATRSLSPQPPQSQPEQRCWTVKKMRNEILNARLSDTKTQPTQWQYNRSGAGGCLAKSYNTKERLKQMFHDYENPTFVPAHDEELIVLPNQAICEDQPPNHDASGAAAAASDTTTTNIAAATAAAVVPLKRHVFIKNGGTEILQLYSRQSLDKIENCGKTSERKCTGKNSCGSGENIANENEKENDASSFLSKKTKIVRMKDNFDADTRPDADHKYYFDETQSLPPTVSHRETEMVATEHTDGLLRKAPSHLMRSDSGYGCDFQAKNSLEQPAVESKISQPDLLKKLHTNQSKDDRRSVAGDSRNRTLGAKKGFGDSQQPQPQSHPHYYADTKSSKLRKNLAGGSSVALSSSSNATTTNENALSPSNAHESVAKNSQKIAKGLPTATTTMKSKRCDHLQQANIDAGNLMNSLMKNLKRSNASATDKKSVFTITYDNIQTKHIDNISLP